QQMSGVLQSHRDSAACYAQESLMDEIGRFESISLGFAAQDRGSPAQKQVVSRVVEKSGNVVSFEIAFGSGRRHAIFLPQLVTTSVRRKILRPKTATRQESDRV